MKPLSRYLYLFPLLIVICLVSSFTNLPTSYRQHHLSLLSDTIPEPEDSATVARIFDKVEIEASFPGGDKAWRSFLERNLNGDIPVKKKAPAGQHTVIIQFVVDKNGKISDIEPLTQLGYGMEEEVVRVLKLSPRWKPAIQDGRIVKAYRKQPVTFWIDEKKKKNRN